MAGNPKKRKAGSSRKPLGRQMLLPMSGARASPISLHNHLALAACRQGQANIDLVGELLKTVYLTFYLAPETCREEHVSGFELAQQSIKALVIRAGSEQQWGLETEACDAVETILRLHDEYLASLPLFKIEEAMQWLAATLEKGSFPSLTS